MWLTAVEKYNINIELFNLKVMHGLGPGVSGMHAQAVMVRVMAMAHVILSNRCVYVIMDTRDMTVMNYPVLAPQNVQV